MESQQTESDHLIHELEEITGRKYELIDIDRIPCREISDPEKLVKDPIVSVSMITYNHEPYIAEAIENVVNQQTDYPFELIIGEDCSTDRTREIVLAYQKKYPEIIRVLVSDHNIGAIKNGFRVEKTCRGKYIANCEGDDYWHRHDKLQLQVDLMQNNPDVGMLHSNADIINMKNNTIIYSVSEYKEDFTTSPFSGPILENLIQNKYTVINATTVIRKELIDKLNEDAVTRLNLSMGDMTKLCFLVYNTLTHYIKDSLATYRIHDNSLMNSTDDPIRGMTCALHADLVRCYFVKKYSKSQCDCDLVLRYLLSRCHFVAYLENNKKRIRKAHDRLKQMNVKISLKAKVRLLITTFPVLGPVARLLINVINKIRLNIE